MKLVTSKKNKVLIEMRQAYLKMEKIQGMLCEYDADKDIIIDLVKINEQKNIEEIKDIFFNKTGHFIIIVDDDYINIKFEKNVEE